MLKIAARVAAIAFLELGNCLRGSYGRLIRMGRISGPHELACAEETDKTVEEYDKCVFHASIYEGTELFVQFENQMRRFDQAMTGSQPSRRTTRSGKRRPMATLVIHRTTTDCRTDPETQNI
jgi:hypothetical protein